MICGLSVDNHIDGEYRTYECDYISSSVFRTKIVTEIGGKKVTIKGNLMAMVTDPLTMYDENGYTLAYAGDAYGYISQDDHGIYIDDTFVINMEGAVSIFGNSYHLKDENGNNVATVEFNATNTRGNIRDNSGTIIASYESNIARNDYTVKICDNDVCSDTAILMIMASYISDVMHDS